MFRLLLATLVASAASFAPAMPARPPATGVRAAVRMAAEDSSPPAARADIRMAVDESKDTKEPAKTFPSSYTCAEPSDDPNISCFLTPDWMGGIGWVCTPTSALTSEAHDDLPEDSY